jgi:adenylate kinase
MCECGGRAAVRMVLLGPPGSGKGTQASAMQRRWGLAHLASGDLLREDVRDDTELGRKAKPYMDAGELVPDELILDMMEERLARPNAQAGLPGQGFVLDGFPRTLAQAEVLDQRLAAMGQRLDAVVCLRVSEEEILRRLSGRLVCPQCHAIYQAETMPPKRPGLCDRCGSPLVQREDEDPEVVRNRLRVYEEQTAPLEEYYRSRGLLHEVDGAIGVDRVLAEVSRLLEASAKRVQAES